MSKIKEREKREREENKPQYHKYLMEECVVIRPHKVLKNISRDMVNEFHLVVWCLCGVVSCGGGDGGERRKSEV